MAESHPMKTSVLPVDSRKIGRVRAISSQDDLTDELEVDFDETSKDTKHLLRAASELRSSNIPVAFPTETVYGLGADATRSSAVQGIYKAKQRPSDNPLIVHFASLGQLRDVLSPPHEASNGSLENGSHSHDVDNDPIPPIYRPLIRKFWPGPLTIILPNPMDSPLAPEVTAGLVTFGARMPANVLALALIKQANVPIAAPSANASTKPSPTAAEHVAFDLDGRIKIIIDGGPCDVGVESTVADGLSHPPSILRPGGISIEQLRSCEGWENVQIGYKNAAEAGSKPKAPGMKYRHYSPKAPVILFEAGALPPTGADMKRYASRLGLVRTRRWTFKAGNNDHPLGMSVSDLSGRSLASIPGAQRTATGFTGLLESLHSLPTPKEIIEEHTVHHDDISFHICDLQLGPDTASIARGIFAALRELDRRNVDAILVEGIDDEEGESAAAVMNRLRKAAEVKVS